MTRCYICHRDVYVFFEAKRRAILRCDYCKLTYTTEKGESVTHENSDKFVREYMQEKEYYGQYFDTMARFIFQNKRKATLLDVGCGIGLFLESATKLGIKSVGVDMSAQAVKFARLKGFDVYQGKIEHMKLKPQSFDVITLFQTIEHIKDPLKLIEALFSLLKPKGILVMTTPSEESFMARVLGKGWFGYQNIEHVFFFNPQSLAILLRKAGFRDIHIHTENGRVLSLPWILTRIFEYYYNKRSLLSNIFLILKPYWKYFRWVVVREPKVNLVSIAVK